MRRSILRELNWRQHPWLVWGLIYGVATFLGLFQASQSVVFWSFEGKSMPWATAVIRGVADWYLWAAWSPLIFQLTQHLPLEQRRWQRAMLVHTPVCVLFSFMTLIVLVPLFQVTRPEMAPIRTNEEVFRLLFVGHFAFYLFVYWAIVGVSHASDYYVKYRDRELRASQLEARLAQAKLQVLKMQLHPHFLFNTLNAISALLHKDVDVADRMIARLGELLRQTLENAGTQEVGLRQELGFIKPYLEIEQARLGPRLTVRLDIDPEAMDARVPYLILQPLVENAIRHGVAARAEPGRVEIRARRDGNTLLLQVLDDGPGLPAQVPLGKGGIGLANTKARLKQLYGTLHQFELANRPQRGLAVTIRLPYREEPAVFDPLSEDASAVLVAGVTGTTGVAGAAPAGVGARA
jgi:signal transduction histidine kinase